MIVAVRDDWRVRCLLGLGLGLVGAALHLAMVWATDAPKDAPISLAAVYLVLAVAAMLGGPVGSLAALFVSALALWLLTPVRGPAEIRELTLFIAGGAILAGVSTFARSIRRRLTTDAVRRNEERLRLAVDAGAIGLFERNFVEGSSTFNGKEQEIFGFGPDAPIGPSPIDALVVEDDRLSRNLALQAAMNPDGDGRYLALYRIRRANDGAIRWVSARAQAYFDNGKATRIVGVNRDVTDEIDAERLLREKAALAEQLTGLAEALPGAIYTYAVRDDGSSHLPYASPKILDVTGFPPEAFVVDMSPIVQRVHIDDLMPAYAAIARSARDNSPWRTTFRYNHPHQGHGVDRGRILAASSRRRLGRLARLSPGRDRAQAGGHRAGGERRTSARRDRRRRRGDFHH